MYLMEYPLDLPGGAQLSTAGICEALIRHSGGEYLPVVVCPKLLKKKEGDYPFPIRTYPMGEKRLPNLLKRILAFKRIIGEEKPDLIHIEMSESLITYGFIQRFFPKIPYIYTDRGMYFGYRKRSQLFMFPVLRKSKMLITTTERNRALWEKNTDIRPTACIPNAASDVFESYDIEKKKKGGVFTIGFAGRICVEKDWPFVPVLIKAFSDAGLIFNVELVLSLFEKGDREKADRLIQDIVGIVGADRFTCYEDLTQEEISDFYYGLDLFIMTSSFESFGKAAIEAMSRKCAILSTAVGGLPEVIGRKENLYSKKNLKRAVAYMKRISGSPALFQAEQEYFFNRFQENYTQKAYYQRHIGVYEQVINGEKIRA